MAKPGVRLVVVISDIHAGSTCGLLSPGFVTSEQNEIKQTPVQKWLWECWENCNGRLKKYIGDDEYALVLNGDLVDGNHHQSKQIISPDIADHVSAAVEILEPLAKAAKKTFVVEGTEVHTGSTENAIARTLKAEPDPNTGKRAWERLTLTVAGALCVFHHHISTTAREYLSSSALGIFLGNEQLAAAKNNEPIPQVLGCGHRHNYGEFKDASGHCFVTPAWQVKTRFGHKVVPAARAKPGLVVLDWRGRPDGSLPIVEPIICRAPTARGATV